MAKKKRKKNYHYQSKKKKQQISKRWIYTIAAMIVVGILITTIGGLTQRKFEMDANNASIAQRDWADEKKQKFIKRLVPDAQTAQRRYGVRSSITLAQAALESDWGESTLASEYHNLFGVKGTDPSNTKLLDTQEYYEDGWTTIKARFRVYQSDSESIHDHALLFVQGTTWNPKQYDGVLSARNYQDAARALQTSGYATDPNYTDKIIKIIQKYHLDDYDNV